MIRPTCLAWLAMIVCGACGALGAEPATRDIQRADDEPFLRLDLPGHTADVLALAFHPDSSRLVSAGRDKVALVWSLAEVPAAGDGVTEALDRARLRERALRWQVRRASRGAIQALAVSAGPEALVAIGGNGAMGSTGEILLVRAADGAFVKTLGGGDRTGHRNAVKSLDFTPDGAWLVSRDQDGQVFAWRRAADWQPVELARRFDEEHGAAVAARLAADRDFSRRPVAAVGAGKAAFAILVNAADLARDPDTWRAVWRVRVVDLEAGGAVLRDLEPPCVDAVEALAASADGAAIASLSGTGVVAVHGAGDGARVANWIPVKPDEGWPRALALSPDGRRVALGIESVDPRPGAPGRIEVHDVAPARRVGVRSVEGVPTALVISADGRWLAWNGGVAHEVFVEELAAVAAAGEPRPRVYGGVGRSITRIAFEDPRRRPPVEEPSSRDITRAKRKRDQIEVLVPQRLAISTAADGTWGRAFDLERLAFAPVGEAAAWSPPEGVPAGWSLRREDAAPPGVDRLRVVRGAEPRGLIDLAIDWQGDATDPVRAVAWLTAAGEAEPFAVAVGTDRGIGVYRFAAEKDGVCELLRWFRGHDDRVTALAVAPGGEWLASGGRDGLAMLWSLAGVAAAPDPLRDRWGVGLAVEGGQLVVSRVDPAGPLAGRDVRVGDRIDRVSWAKGRRADGTAERTELADAAAIRDGLATVPFGMQAAFTTSRAGVAREGFQRMPAWENVAALVIRPDDEWALWTPRGYYAASENGDTFFGWLVNRGLDKLPRFHRAKDFRRRLERPDVVSRLLAEGSLDAALRAVGGDGAESSSIVLPALLAAAPTVRITAPVAGEAVAGEATAIEADIELPGGVELARVRAYASGALAAATPRLLEDTPADAATGAPRRQRYRWEGVRLPAGEHQLVQVFAATRQGTTGLDGVAVASRAAPQPPRRPRLFLLAAGVDRYPRGQPGDEYPRIPDLGFAEIDATSVRDALASAREAPVELAYQRLLRGSAVTRRQWLTSAAELAEACRRADVGPDDLLVVFLAGHALATGGAEQRYAFLCHDIDARRITVDRAGALVVPRDEVLTWDDFGDFADLPCRKLALVDTCHAGALGPGERGTALRDFQENLVVVVAASADDQKSFEDRSWQHGAFTRSLLDALSGSADGHGGRAEDGIVTLHEVIDYTLDTVPRLTAELVRRGQPPGAETETARGTGKAFQNPTVSPEAVVPFVRLPLARVRRP